ncbi:MAG: alpha/beta fold hydrolase [bacterium]
MDNLVAVNGIKLFVERTGEGAPLLMIPGLGAGNWLWSKSVSELSKYFELIMPELRGSGRSDKPDQRYSVALFASDLRVLLEELKYPRVYLLGVSMGGFIAQYFAAQWPQSVLGLALAGTSLGGENQIGPDGDILCRTIRPHGRNRRERLEDGYRFNFTDDFLQNCPQELEAITAWRTEYPQPEFAYYRQLLAGYAYDGESRAKRIQAPILICAGERDPLVPLEDVRRLHTQIPQAKLSIYQGKHLFFYEMHQKFNQEIIEFFSNISVPSNND